MTYRWAVVVCGMFCMVSTRVGSQSPGPRVSFALGVMGAGIVTQATPGVFGQQITEGYFTQPNVMGQASAGPISLVGTVNLEGFTLRRGELNAGIYGEGYADRRHPHTLVHELMLTASSPDWHSARASLSVGKGFTPYGTDDPMMRPFVKYPVNHHHAQIIERVQALATIRVGASNRGAALEHAFFNGDEPVDPFSSPKYERFGDSRATRLTLMPARSVELQVSRAFVRSPGITQGGAFDHTQTSASVRFDRSSERSPMSHSNTGPDELHNSHGADGGSASDARDMHDAQHSNRRYLIVEWAQTDEGFGPTRVFRFNSVLAEALWSQQGWSVALRGERTERPESARLLDPFRIANGHIDFQLVGITRFDVATAQLGLPPIVLGSPVQGRIAPFLEVGLAHATAVRTPAVFVPREFYGAERLWSVTLGARVHVGSMRARMGRYGVLDQP